MRPSADASRPVSAPAVAGPFADSRAGTGITEDPTAGESAARREAAGGAVSAPARALRTTLWTSTTYFGEGLPYSVVHLMTPQYLTAVGASLQAIGLSALYGLAWNFKFLWAPFVDLRGTKRRWVVATQLAVAAIIASLAFHTGSGNLRAYAWTLVFVALAGATQDISVDGFYLQALDERSQAAYSGVRVMAFRIAMLVGSGALVILAGTVSWPAAYLTAGALMAALALLHHWVLPPPAAPAIPAAAPGRGLAEFLRAFTSFLDQPRIWVTIPFILTFRLGDAMMLAMQVPFLKHLGLDTAERGFIQGTLGIAGGITGVMLGGILIGRYGLNRCLWPLSVVQSLSLPGYVYMAVARPERAALATILTFEQFAAGMGTAVFMVFLMRRCRARYQASHFAIATALMSITVTLTGTVSGFLAQELQFPRFFMLCWALTGPALALIPFLPRQAVDATPPARG